MSITTLFVLDADLTPNDGSPTRVVVRAFEVTGDEAPLLGLADDDSNMHIHAENQIIQHDYSPTDEEPLSFSIQGGEIETDGELMDLARDWQSFFVSQGFVVGEIIALPDITDNVWTDGEEDHDEDED